MTFFYLIKDNNSDDSQLYSVNASCKGDADGIFLKNLFPLLPNSDCIDLDSAIYTLQQLEYDLTCFDTTKAVTL